MSEKIDLNALRRDEHETLPVKTKEERVAELEAKVARLEAESMRPTQAETFAQLSEEAQRAKLDSVNKTLPPEEQYSLEEYVQEISKSKGPDLNAVRLSAARAELKRLLAE